MSKQNSKQHEKDEKRELIILSAKKLFNEVGFENTTMNDISAKSSFTNRTIYRYFTNKDDLFYAVICSYYEELLDEIIIKTEKHICGHKKVTSIFLVYKDFSLANPRFTAFTIRANEIIKQLRFEDSSPYQKKYLEVNHRLFDMILEFFKNAQEDKKIRTDVEITQLTVSLIMLFSGFMDMFCSSGNKYSQYFNLDETSIINFTMDRFFELLKNKSEELL